MCLKKIADLGNAPTLPAARIFINWHRPQSDENAQLPFNEDQYKAYNEWAKPNDAHSPQRGGYLMTMSVGLGCQAVFSDH